MAYTYYETVQFGASKAGLTTVGYKAVDTAGQVVIARTTDGVTELGNGGYAANVSYPDEFVGVIVWDTGETPPVTATASVNPPDTPEEDARLDAIEDDVATLDRLVLGQTLAPGVTADGIVRAGIPEIDDCKILTRLKAFLVDQGALSTVEHVIRDRLGRPVDLSQWIADTTVSEGSSSSSSSASGTSANGRVRVRVHPFLGAGISRPRNPIWELDHVSVIDAVNGVVHCRMEDKITEHPGIYEIFFAVVDETDKPVIVDRGLMSVEKSLFPAYIDTAYKDLGPPTIQEVRMRLMDSSANENLLLDDIEFKDEQILLALTEPVRYWNESPPPIERYTTRDFPYRGAWISGVLAQLHMMTANHYRRNRLQHSAGGTSIDDKNKEREYMTEGTRLWNEFTEWCHAKKIEHNLRHFAGTMPSAYSFRSGW